MKKDGVHYLNDNWVTTEDAKISAFDLSVVRGYGIFDFLRTYGNKPFCLKEHIDRLFSSAALLSIKVPKSRKQIETIVRDGIQKNSFTETAIKIIVTGGESEDSVTPGKPSFIVLFTKAPEYPAWFYTKGVKVITSHHKRVLPQVKSLNYFQAIHELRKAKALGAKEVLYFDPEQGITECTRSNIFFVKGNALITPKEEDVLHGITRRVVIKIAKELSIPVTEEKIPHDSFKRFSEAFITASTVEVLPVMEIDDKKIGDGKLGRITKQIMMKFKEKTAS